MSDRDGLAEMLRKLRMDMSNAQSKLTDVIQRIDGANVPLVQPLPPEEAIRRQIENGVLTDMVDLEAELRAHGLNGSTEKELREVLAAHVGGFVCDVDESAGLAEPGSPNR